MRIIRTIKSLRRAIQKIKKENKTIGFVPTMGALHEGHLSLVRASKKENDITVMSIFVNPTQFGPREDFKNYPRVFKKDKKLAKKEKVDIIFYPSVEEMYTNGRLAFIDVEKITENLCGKFRPGHFKGVATVVGKLLNIVLPDVMYLGEKDAQQVVVLKKVVDDLNFPVKIRICPTIREPDGLAMSSRNAYLTDHERKEAPVLFKALKKAKQKIMAGKRSTKQIIGLINRMIKTESCGKIQYVECVSADDLTPLKALKGRVMIALAVYFGTTRLIDNITLKVK